MAIAGLKRMKRAANLMVVARAISWRGPLELAAGCGRLHLLLYFSVVCCDVRATTTTTTTATATTTKGSNNNSWQWPSSCGWHAPTQRSRGRWRSGRCSLFHPVPLVNWRTRAGSILLLVSLLLGTLFLIPRSTETRTQTTGALAAVAAPLLLLPLTPVQMLAALRLYWLDLAFVCSMKYYHSVPCKVGQPTSTGKLNGARAAHSARPKF